MMRYVYKLIMHVLEKIQEIIKKIEIK